MPDLPINNLPTSKVALTLFHNDLRVSDNQTLLKAAELASAHEGRLILVYAQALVDSATDKNWSQAYHFDEMGTARAQFLAESLADLDQSLQRLGNRLLYLKHNSLKNNHLKHKSLNSNVLKQDDSTQSSDSFAQLCQLIEQQDVTDVFVSQTADYAQNQAYDAVRNKYPKISWHTQSVSTLFAEMPTDNLPQSFTQFRKKVEYDHDLLIAAHDLIIVSTPTTLAPPPDAFLNSNEDNRKLFFENQSVDNLSLVSCSTENQPQNQSEKRFKGGETNALEHLNRYFSSDAPSTYKTTRNALDEWTHSTKFSPWLANGSLSVKILLNRLRHYQAEVTANDSTYWIWFELLWREYFYWYAMTHQKQLFTFQGISNHKPTTEFDQQRLQQWQNGDTKYPIVNACMHQLRQTGYMSNRGRQIVASCFIHELGLDWRYGATYFEQQLIDYDVGSNWGNWQYLAGVGADPRGCRQFNLVKQTQQHDPNNEFIDRWA